MKRKIIIGIALAMGMVAAAMPASAAGSCREEGKCADKQIFQQFTQETSGLVSALKAKDLELREQYAFDRIDASTVGELEAELDELKGQINTVGEKFGIPLCCRS
ncbi:hypothetical protein Geob_2570 [Geotalea daltonii FRC-32]|uniref:Uncharacterized protein n=1 Tax=Geotalea daltonii (strain DSM 22248 / JCM 15807 / FRC-32) TaxID=316067 RepID=B9M0R8_GEODF|nr:hypothetical protein [Geotalea daltonii]ACM20921.1 hypothetical protein Geob_2570 [Geotalea daltonii FRC-32]